MIRKTHCETSPHRFCDVSLPTIFELTRFTAQIWSSQHYFTLKSADLTEAWKAGLGEKIIRLWQWFTRYFLIDKEPWQTRLYICRVSEAIRKCSLLFLLFIMFLVILFFNQKKKKPRMNLNNEWCDFSWLPIQKHMNIPYNYVEIEHQEACSFLNPYLFFHFWEFIKSIIY